MKNLDVRGLSCPEPVLCTQKAVKAGERYLEIVLDTSVSVENVRRYLESQGYRVSVAEGKDYTIRAEK